MKNIWFLKTKISKFIVERFFHFSKKCDKFSKMLKKCLSKNKKLFCNIHSGFFIISLIVSFNHSANGRMLFDLSNTTRVCLTVAENEVYRPAFKPKPGYCDGWHCWQSQLKLTNKKRISRIMNNLRNDLATNIVNMHKLSWHWTLELEALRASKKCNRRYLEEYDEPRYIEGLGSSLYCENGCLYKSLTQNPSQDFLILVLHELLMNNSLQDFDSDGNYRRANIMYFGCAMVVRSTLTDGVYEDIYHLVCVFCTNEQKITTIYGKPETEYPCPPLSVRGADPKYPRLCGVQGRQSLYICPTMFFCPSDEKNRQVGWKTRNPGRKAELIMVETEIGPTLLVGEENIGSYDDEGTPRFHTEDYFLDTDGKYLAFLSHYPQLPKTVYSYSFLYIQHYNSILYKLTNGSLTVQRPFFNEKPVIYEAATATEGYNDAWCCTYLLILSSILTSILGVLIAYTVITG